MNAIETEPADSLIKFRERDAARWMFLTPRAGGNRLRIHAARFTRENAETLIAKHAPGNPKHEFKIVPI